ncbi:23S rRNA pseudouridine(955/2504/2580) synthase RluC [Candidatus Fukatsuia anoeciicola]|uniref:23S rRNA pseudouridine(955/2504/2580) synthase RluC n=1 Tax=Candidatus Fukatsuia anoeciicola TaxID=2994492 RepID=UPI0034646C5C
MKINSSSVQLINISADEAGQRLDNFLFARLKGVPKNLIYRIIRKGKVRVNKGRVKFKYKLVAADIVRLPPVRVAQRKMIQVLTKLDKFMLPANCILFEDEYLLVLNKPSGIAVHGGSKLNFGIIEALRALRPEARFLELVHRLDRDTSGVLLIAKKRSILRLLHQQLRLKNMQKNYLALVRGQWPSHYKVIEAPLLKNILHGGTRVVKVNNIGKPSKTHFQVKERFLQATLIKVSPITGRTHQIRVHTLHAGCPIAGDNRYGDREFNLQLQGIGLYRLFLHANTLRFKHPYFGTNISIEAPLDNQLQYCLQTLHKTSLCL